MSCWMNVYYIVILAWAIFYFFMSLRAGNFITVTSLSRCFASLDITEYPIPFRRTLAKL